MPPPSRHQVQVCPRENLFLQLVEHLSWNGLIAQNTFCSNSIIFEFNQHELFVPDKYGTRAVSFVEALSLFYTHFFQQVLNQYWCLTEDRCRCFSCWKIGAISHAEDVAVPDMLKSVNVDIEPSRSVGKLAVSDEFRSSLSWNEVHKIKAYFGNFSSGILKNCLLSVFVNFLKSLSVVTLHAFSVKDGNKSITEFYASWEQNWCRRIEIQFEI